MIEMRCLKNVIFIQTLKKDFRNGMKEAREGICDNVSYVNKVMDCIKVDSCEFGKSKPNFSEIYKDLLLSEQINSPGMFEHLYLIQTHLLLIMLAILGGIRHAYSGKSCHRMHTCPHLWKIV